MAAKEFKVKVSFESNKGYPMRLMIDRSAAHIMKSGESYETVLAEGSHEVMISVSIRKKPVIIDLKKDISVAVRVEDVFKAIDVKIE